MIRRVSLLSLLLALGWSTANASRCMPPDPWSPDGPNVIVEGVVTAVRQSDASINSNGGAASVFVAPGRSAGSNTATIEVSKIYKGVVAKTIEVTSDLQDGINLGMSFRPGPIFLMAWRTNDGTIVSSVCGVLHRDLQRELEPQRQAVEAAEARFRRSPTELPAAQQLSASYRHVGDTERDSQLWQTFVQGSPSVAAFIELGKAYISAKKFEPAKAALQEAVRRGPNDDAQALLNRALLMNGEAADLAKADLEGIQAKQLYIAGADLVRRNLDGARIEFLNARGANLSDAQARKLVAYRVDLTDARLPQIDLTEASLRQATLRNADLRGAILTGANLTITDAGSADFNKGRAARARFDAQSETSSLAGAKFDGADLRGASFRYIRDMRGASFRNADLTAVAFEAMNVSGVDFSGAKLSGSTWRNTIYDCATVFPSDFDRDVAGLTNYSAPCPGEPTSAAAHVDRIVEACGAECHAWLRADPARFISIRDRHNQSIILRYRAGEAEDAQCSPEAVRLMNRIVGIDHQALASLRATRFCPRVAVAGMPEGTSYFAAGQDWNGMIVDVTRASFLTRADFEEMVARDFAAAVRDRRRMIWPAVSSLMSRRPKDTDLLSGFVSAALQTYSPRSGGGNEAREERTAVEHIAAAAALDAAMAGRLFDELDEAPNRAKLFGYRTFLERISGVNAIKFQPGPSTCGNATRIQKHLEFLADSAKVPAAWEETKSQCRKQGFSVPEGTVAVLPPVAPPGAVPGATEVRPWPPAPAQTEKRAGSGPDQANLVSAMRATEHGQWLPVQRPRVALDPTCKPVLPGDALVYVAVVGYGDEATERPMRGRRPGVATVNVPVRTRPVVVVLLSLESVVWKLQTSPDTKLAAVFASGYHDQVVEGAPSGVPVIIDAGGTGQAPRCTLSYLRDVDLAANTFTFSYPAFREAFGERPGRWLMTRKATTPLTWPE